MNEIQNQIINEYCSNDLYRLKQICNPLLYRKGITQDDMNYDDLCSLAMDTLINSVERYSDSKNCKFSTFLVGNIKRTFYDWTRDNRRLKRCNLQTDKNGRIIKDGNNNPIVIHNLSLDAKIDDDLEWSEKIASDFNIEDEVSDELFSSNQRIESYLSRLPEKARMIIEMKMNGFPADEIKSKAGLSDKEYNDYCGLAKSFSYTNILFRKDDNKAVEIEEEKNMNGIITQTLEKSKPDKLSISTIIKKIDNYTIRFDHPLQRASEQWNSAMKGNLISDILQGNPIPPLVFAEQVVNGLATIWDLDGKQRCTNAYSYKNNGYKVTKNIRRWNISYQARIKDESGKPILDESGFPQSERKEFDIRGKKFSDLPEELQDRFLEYNFEAVQYLNCSGEDIAYHIARYNEGKPMSASQKGITRLGEEYASIVKGISTMPFFKDLGGYKVSEANNGTINRVIVESVMSSYFLNDWKKKQEDMCSYIKENAAVEHFDSFEEMVNRISKVGTEEVFNMFDSKDTFIWFGLFAKFINSGLDDGRFIDFMDEFHDTLYSKEIDGISFDGLNGKSTKDKNVVLHKMEHLEKLMVEYLDISLSDIQCKEIDIMEFVKENVDSDVTEDDIQQYENVFNDLILNVDNTSKLLNRQNRPSLIALVAYSFKNDLDLDNWIVDYFERNSTYNQNQKQNYNCMIQDLEKYLELCNERIVA